MIQTLLIVLKVIYFGVKGGKGILKEIFVLKDGKPLFFYSTSTEDGEYDDKTLLSSGVLSAISAFSEEARSSMVESFSSENELFLFSKIQTIGADFIGVFSKDTDQDIAKVIVENIKSKLVSDNLLENSDLVFLESQAQLDFKDKIPHIINRMSDTKDQKEYLTRQFSRINGAMVGMSIDVISKERIWSMAKPRPLFKEQLVQDYLLLHSVTNNMVTRLGWGTQYLMINIESSDYRVSTLYNGAHVVVLSTSIIGSFNELQSMVAKMAHYPNFDRIQRLDTKKTINSQFVLEDNSIVSDGEASLPANAAIFVQTFLNNLETFFKSLTNRFPSSCVLFTGQGMYPDKKIIIEAVRPENKYIYKIV